MQKMHTILMYIRACTCIYKPFLFYHELQKFMCNFKQNDQNRQKDNALEQRVKTKMAVYSDVKRFKNSV